MKMILKMLFFSFSNVIIMFVEQQKLIQRSYYIAEALSTTDKIELIDIKNLPK